MRDEVAFFFNDPFGKIAPEHLPRVDPDGVPVFEFVAVAHGQFAHQNWAVRLEHFQPALPGFVIAEDLEQHLATGAGREQDVVHIQERRVVGHQVARLVRLELEPPTQGAGPAAEIVQGQLRGVVEKDFVLQICLHQRAGPQRYPVEERIHVFQGAHPDFKSEFDFEHGFPAANPLQMDLVIIIDGEVDLREGDVFLGVEIVGEVLVGEHLLPEHDALARIDPAERPGPQGPASDHDSFRALVFEEDQVVVAERHQFFLRSEAAQTDVGGLVASKAQAFQGGLTMLVDRFVGFLARVELVDNVDGLSCHPQLRHEPVVRNHLLLVEACPRNQVVQLDAQHDFSLRAQLGAQLRRHRRQVMLLIERLAEQFAQLGVHGLRVVVPEESQGGINLLAQHFFAAVF